MKAVRKSVAFGKGVNGSAAYYGTMNVPIMDADRLGSWLNLFQRAGPLRRRRHLDDSPRQLFAIIAATIFLIHALTMPLLEHSPLPHWLRWLIESAVLVLLLFPILYRFSFRPLILHLRECQRAEEQMRESEHKYRHLFENLSDAAFLVDVETVRILDANQQAQRMLGRPRAEIIGTSHVLLHPSHNADDLRSRLNSISQKNEPAHFNLKTLIVNGNCVCMHIGVAPVALYGHKLALVLYRGITDARVTDIVFPDSKGPDMHRRNTGG